MNTINCTGDACKGDTITFSESVFTGSFRRPKYAGERTITATIISDSYGSALQQHTFSLLVISSTGHDPLPSDSIIRRKGRNIYRNGTTRAPWPDESERTRALSEKHGRGTAARKVRDSRRHA